MNQAEFEYDVCLSFAGEDRRYVEEVAAVLKSLKVAVFYDQYSQADLWGKDLYVHLDAVYRKKARYCVVFISEHYSKKLWTNHERKSAQARAFVENREYILPARFDDTDIPGILPTVGFVSLKEMTPEAFAHLIQSKLQGSDHAAPTAGGHFRRIYYEGFECSHLSECQIADTIGQLWLIGKRGHWQGSIAAGVYQLANYTGPDASLTNRIRYFEPDDNLVDLGDCRVSLRVAIGPPNDAHSGAGLLFRMAEDGEAYYAFLLHPGNSISLALAHGGKLEFLWSDELFDNKQGDFVTLKAVGLASSLALYANGRLVHTVRDAHLLSGSTGAIALSVGQFTFDDFSVYLPTG